MNSLSSKPFGSKTFFLDLSSYPYHAKLSKDLTQLGAKEVFSIPSASFVISDRPCIKSDCNSPIPFSGPRSNSPLFRDSTLDYINSPVVHSPTFEQKVLGERVKPMCRGLSMLMKANEKTQGHKKEDILDLCKRFNIKIYPLQKVIKFIEKYKMKYLKVRSSKKKHESENVSKITPPFIKIEDVKREFKPKYKSLPSSKIVDSLLFKCVRNLVKNTKQSIDVKGFARPALHEISMVSQISRNENWKTEPVSVTKPPGLNTVSNSMSVCIPSTVVKEERKNPTHANKTKKDKKKAKREYCEICRIHYTSGETHFKKGSHKAFLENAENYAELKELISTLPSIEDFIAKIKDEEESTSDNCTDEIQLFDGPISMESCSNIGSNTFPKSHNDYGCMTENYSLKEDEIISSSCSCPSTPLPYLQDRETTVKLLSLKRLRNDTSALSSQGILGQVSHAINYNSHMADSNLYDNNVSHIPETYSNCVYYSNMDNNCSSPLNLSCENQVRVMCPVQRITGSIFPFREKQISTLECPSKTLLTMGESLNNCESLCLPTENYYVSSAAPLDLSYSADCAQNVIGNSGDIVEGTAHSNSNCMLDSAKMCVDSNLNRVTDDISFSAAVDSVAYAETKIVNNAFDNPEPVPSLVNLISVEDQVNGSNHKLGNADCETEIYSSESDFDAENLNKIVASCIEEVDKGLENDSPTKPNDLDNQRTFFSFDTTNLSSPADSHIERLVTSMVSRVSLAEQTESSAIHFPVTCKSTESSFVNEFGSNSVSLTDQAETSAIHFPVTCKSTESSIVNEFGKHLTEATSPPAKRIRLQLQNFCVPDVLNNKIFEQSNAHEQQFTSATVFEPANEVAYLQEQNFVSCKSVESSSVNDFDKLSPEATSPPAKRMRLQLQNSLVYNEPSNKSGQSNVYEKELTSPSVESVHEIAHFQETNFVKENQITLPFQDECNQSCEFKTQAIPDVAEINEEQSNQGSIINLSEFSLSTSQLMLLPIEAKVSRDSEDALDVHKSEMNSITRSTILKNYTALSYTRKTACVVKLCESTLNSSDIPVYSDVIGLNKPSVLEPVICSPYEAVKQSDEFALSDIDLSKPPNLEPVISFPFEIVKHLEEPVSSDVDNFSMPPILEAEDIFPFKKSYVASNNHLVCTSGNFTYGSTSNTLCEVQAFDYDLMHDIEKRISKAMEKYNISSEEFNYHDAFFVLDETGDDDPEAVVDFNESNDLPNLNEIKFESFSDESNRIAFENTTCQIEQSLDSVKTLKDMVYSFNGAAEESDITHIIKDHLDYILNNVCSDLEVKSGVEFNAKEKDSKEIDQDSCEEIEARLNAVTYDDVGVAVMEIDVVDNLVDEKIDYTSTISDLEGNYSIGANKENGITIYEEVTACMNDIINSIGTLNRRETFLDTNIDCEKEQNKHYMDGTSNFVNKKDFHDNSTDMEYLYNTKHRNICDKEVRILIPKLTFEDCLLSNSCGNNIIKNTDLSDAQNSKTMKYSDNAKHQNNFNKEIRILIPKLTAADISKAQNLTADTSCHNKIQDAFEVNSSVTSGCSDMPAEKNYQSSNTNIKKENTDDERKTSEDDSSEIYSNYNIRKFGDVKFCGTLPLQVQYFRSVSDTSEEANSSLNESLNSSSQSSDNHCRTSDESINSLSESYTYDYSLPQPICDNPVSSDDVQNRTVHIVFINPT